MTYDNEAGTSNRSMSVSAMFDTNADAQNAVSRLETLGISRTQIRTVEGAAQSTEQRASTTDDTDSGIALAISSFLTKTAIPMPRGCRAVGFSSP